MTDAAYAKQYWKIVEQCEAELYRYIHSLDLAGDILQAEHRFDKFDPGKPLSRIELERLHKHIETWIANGLQVREYVVLLRDAAKRKRIKAAEALYIWLLAACCLWYASIFRECGRSFPVYMAAFYKWAFLKTANLTGVVFKPYAWNKDPAFDTTNPIFGRTLQYQLWLEAQYFARQFAAHAQQAGGQMDAYIDKQAAAMENRLLCRSKNDGWNGILDKQIVFVTGYTVLQACKDAGARRVRFLAVTDKHSTRVCQRLNWKEFDVDELEIGVNAPPIVYDRETGETIPHPCRSVLIAVA